MLNSIKHLIQSELKSNKYDRDHYLKNQFNYANNLYSKDMKAHFSCVNSIEFSNNESDHLISGGDDKRVLLWNVNKDIISEKCSPITMKTQHNSNIFALAWDNENQRIFSGGNDHQVIVHDAETLQVCDLFLHENSVHCIKIQPKQSHIFATACESGQISLYDLRLSNTDPIILATSSSSNSYDSIRCAGGAFYSCCFNPIETNLIATANEISGISLIDIRMKSVILRYQADSSNQLKNKSQESKHSAFNNFKQMVTSISFNNTGKQLVALRKDLRPCLYFLNDPYPYCYFDHEDFSNNCTLKTSCFAGQDDEFFVSGSDDFCVYVWKIPIIKNIQDSESENLEKNPFLINDVHLKLKGHRSIVNQCRYNKKYHLLATSGVEKILKIWSPYKMPGDCTGGLLGRADEYTPKRKMYTYNDLFSFRNNQNRSLVSGTTNTSTVSMVTEMDSNDLALISYVPVIRNRSNTEIEESVEEDPIMIAFFDSQVNRQRKLDKESSSFNNKQHRTKFKRKSSSSFEESSNSMYTFESEAESENFIENVNNETSNTSESSTSSNESDDDMKDNLNYKSKKSDNKSEGFSLSSSQSSSSSSYTSSEEDSNEVLNGFMSQKKGKKISKNSLRDRIRNLRHRRSLNIESQSDFKQVLDSLNVVVEESQNNSKSSFVSNNLLNSQIEIEISDNLQKCSPKNSNEGTSNESFLPKTSKYPLEKSTIVKNMNEHKRRIELEEYELTESSRNPKMETFNDSIDENPFTSDSNSTETNSVFKKIKKSDEASTACNSNKISSKKNYRSHNSSSSSKKDIN